MKITDCDISRRAQVALYKRGFSTIEKLRNPNINDGLFESLKCEPMNMVNEIANLVSIVQSGKMPKSIKGKSIAYRVGLDYPKNLYDSMIKLLQKKNHPALEKLPFNDEICSANVFVLNIINSLIMTSNKVLSDDDRKLLIYRYVLLYSTKDVVEKFGTIVDKQDRSFDKKLIVIFNKIARRLCFMYGSEDIEDMGISLKAEVILHNAGIKTKNDLLQADLPRVLARRNVDKSILDEISDLVKELTYGSKTVDFSVYDLKEYPYNIFLGMLKVDAIASSQESNFNKVINTFLSDECNIINERSKSLLYKKYKEFKDDETVGKELGINRLWVYSRLRRVLIKLAMVTRALYHSEDSIFRLNIDDDIKKSLLNKGVYYVPDYSIFDSDLDKDALQSLIDKGIYSKLDYLDALAQLKEEGNTEKYSSLKSLGAGKLDLVLPLKEYKLPERTCIVLKRIGIDTIDELMDKSEKDLAMTSRMTDEHLKKIRALKRKVSKSKGYNL